MSTDLQQDEPLARAHFKFWLLFLFSVENGSVLVVKSTNFVVSQTRV